MKNKRKSKKNLPPNMQPPGCSESASVFEVIDDALKRTTAARLSVMAWRCCAMAGMPMVANNNPPNLVAYVMSPKSDWPSVKDIALND